MHLAPAISHADWSVPAQSSYSNVTLLFPFLAVSTPLPQDSCLHSQLTIHYTCSLYWSYFMMHFAHILLLFAILAGIALSSLGGKHAPITPDPTVEPAPIIRHRQHFLPWYIQNSPTGTEDLVEPATPADAPKHSSERREDKLASPLDYRCGEKHGRCPSGTCCSGAGKPDRLSLE